jgi:hypothetical protein
MRVDTWGKPSATLIIKHHKVVVGQRLQGEHTPVVTTGTAVNGNDDRVCRVTKRLRVKGYPSDRYVGNGWILRDGFRNSIIPYGEYVEQDEKSHQPHHDRQCDFAKCFQEFHIVHLFLFLRLGLSLVDLSSY